MDCFKWNTFTSRKNRIREREKQIYKISERVTSFFWDADGRPDFEEREGQQDMAFEILDALKKDQHILVEAGVGIGKSYAYLVPLLLYNHYTGKPAVIATSTIALQEQLLNDAAALQELLETQCKVILAKGQTNYLCRRRADEYLARPDAEMADALRELIDKGCQDRADFPSDLPSGVWDRLCILRYGHSCWNCHHSCAYRRMREDIRFTDGIVICNQDFLTAHLQKLFKGQDGLINRTVEVVVIDEAHNLEGKVRSATTERISQNGLLQMINAAQNDVMPTEKPYIQKDLDAAQRAVRAFFQCLRRQMQRQIADSAQDMKYAERFFFHADSEALPLLSGMAEALDSLSENIQVYSSFDLRRGGRYPGADDFYAKAKEFSDMVSDLGSSLLWIEKRGNSAELVYCPENTRDIISNLYFRGDVCTILTSATLTNAAQGSFPERYAYFISNTGFPLDENGFLSGPKPSPFPYDEHAMVYYCDDLPHPREDHDAFIQQGVERLIEILEISNGKALVLFTAKTDLEEVYALLLQRNLPYKILIQQPGASQDQVLSEFRNNVDSVLLGTGAYWEGIDIRGKSLSNLVIFRLPFPVPDPIIEHKVSLAKDGLMDVRVPEMIIKLKQGIGRLIRSFSDKGIVSIIDPRLRDQPKERYHDAVWASIPIQNRTTSLAELRVFYHSLMDEAN